MLQTESVSWKEEVISMELNRQGEKYRGDNRVKLYVL